MTMSGPMGLGEKIAKTLRYQGRALLRDTRRLRAALRPPSLERPVFVVGCSRGGTTLAYKILSQARELGSMHRETHEFWNSLHPISERGWQSHRIPESMASAADRKRADLRFYVHTGRRRIVDKNNQAGFSIPYLRALYPDAQFVYVKRNPGDNLNSLIQGWSRPDEFGAWSLDLPEEVKIEGGRYRRWCFFLPEGWRDYTKASIQEVCAFQYEAINTDILEAGSVVPESNWQELFYEDLLTDPIAALSRLFGALGLAFDDEVRQRCMEAIAVPYNAFSEIRVAKWQNGSNRARIGSVLGRLESVAGRMGYQREETV